MTRCSPWSQTPCSGTTRWVRRNILRRGLSPSRLAPSGPKSTTVSSVTLAGTDEGKPGRKPDTTRARLEIPRAIRSVMVSSAPLCRSTCSAYGWWLSGAGARFCVVSQAACVRWSRWLGRPAAGGPFATQTPAFSIGSMVNQDAVGNHQWRIGQARRRQHLGYWSRSTGSCWPGTLTPSASGPHLKVSKSRIARRMAR